MLLNAAAFWLQPAAMNSDVFPCGLILFEKVNLLYVQSIVIHKFHIVSIGTFLKQSL